MNSNKSVSYTHLDVYKRQMISYAKEIAAQINEWEKEKKEAEDKIKEYTSVIDDMGHFVGLNLNLDEVNSCEFVQVRFGALPKENVEKLAVDVYKRQVLCGYYLEKSHEILRKPG